ncbi:MAG: fused MFS/spermidine synthase [Lachnospiraceae bacterium]|nr:fused MFS/spermidine synthase [Lachnospiraceae bacterium]
MKERKILKNKIYLYLTEFFAGMSVMAVELGASRLMAPYFSSSQIVWTIIIGTIMIAMALGNIYGGRSADKDPDPDKLYARILLAAVWIAAIPVLGKYVIIAIAGVMVFTINSNFLVMAAFAACMIVFVFPLFLLGTVTPSLVKYTVDSLDDSGKTVGNLNAFNTIGSIIGTFVPTFISIPAVGTAISFLIFAGILLLLGAVYFISGKVKSVRLPVSMIIFVLCCVFGHDASFAFWQDGLTYEGESVYNYLQVYETDSSTVLSTNVLFGVQSVYRKDKGLTGMYYDYAMAAPFMAGIHDADRCDILILGMGTGTFATQCRRYFDNTDITGVEIDEKITELARTYFELPEDVPVYSYDGRAYLYGDDKKYDVIMVDAYQDITIPFQMSSLEFFTQVKEHLKDDGVMVVNMNMKSEAEGSINEYLADTIASVFNEVLTVDVRGATNRELFASMKGELAERLKSSIAKDEQEDLKNMMNRVYAGLETYEGGEHVMTDDRAPVELLGMRVIDSIIADEVAYYKKVYAEDGLKGLMEVL